MPKQPAFPGLRDAMKKKVTRREQFLAELDAVVPWCQLLALIAPHYSKAGPKGGRPPMPLEVMLRVYFLQNWYALSDPMAEDTLYDSEAMRRFAGIELGDDRIPDETTILKFRHLLERHGLTEAIFADVTRTSPTRGSRCARARWWMRPSSTRHPPPRTRLARATPRCHAQGPEGWHAASSRRTGQPHHRDGQGQGRASVPGDQASVRPREDPLSRPRQEPRPALHAVRARQPVPGATEADGMRASLPEICRTAHLAGLTGRNPPPKPGLTSAEALRPPSRRSRSRLSDVP